MPKKILFVILDGVGDISQRTALKEANKPKLDYLAENSYCGLINNSISKHPGSGISIFILLGYPKSEYPGRGYIEARGIGLEPIPDAVYLRANFATVMEKIENKQKTGEYKPELIVKDRRAGRDVSGLKEMSEDIKSLMIDGVKVSFHKSLGHRGVVALTSVGMSPDITGSDPMEEGKKVLEIEATSPDAEKTAASLNKWEEKTYDILKNHPMNEKREFPANYILLRGIGQYRHIKPFKENYGLDGAVVAAAPVVKGLGRIFEMEIINVLGATGDLKSNLAEKTLAALEILKKKDFVLLHMKGTDVAAHDKNFVLRRKIIEKIDDSVFKRILEYVDFEKTLLIVTSDHLTSIETGQHLSGSYPFLAYTKGIEKNSVKKFDEESCKNGPTINISEFMEKVLSFS